MLTGPLSILIESYCNGMRLMKKLPRPILSILIESYCNDGYGVSNFHRAVFFQFS